jgi:hypothetical protein
MEMSWSGALDYAMSGFGPHHGFIESVGYVNRILLVHFPLVLLMPVNVYFWSKRLRKYDISWMRIFGRWVFYVSLAFVPWSMLFSLGPMHGGPDPWIVAQNVTYQVAALLVVHLFFALTAWNRAMRDSPAGT